MNIESRSCLIVFIKSINKFKNLYKYGMVYYVSKSSNYVIMYVNTDNLENIKDTINQLNFVNKVTVSSYKKIYNQLSMKEKADISSKKADEY
ncbi:DUF2129 domain-containing protein [Apilactobacillus xinyiensis]|uniref:YlbG family protein n=1 Tax=Apilactobacillus xinyiensis TaxID=2841032 RepID=A0ABT0I1X6_9LACO|nr:DUF2129 domain-containing protein [Apilactobacillus xinyiensis]MCK8624722.1 YlbG family protein [Apilactobacillus xinyiensis]MCL0318837.1 YlbG family protein [Apilactobacillus xinyiensis]MCL0329921.1 YlbG family protein [Apilactobacillus xinyiensis]